jgi:hypothetical protein
MPEEYNKIACTIGRILEEGLRDCKSESIPERLAELLAQLAERDGLSSTEADKQEALSKKEGRPPKRVPTNG